MYSMTRTEQQWVERKNKNEMYKKTVYDDAVYYDDGSVAVRM